MPATTRISGLALTILLVACFYAMVLGDALAGRPGAWIAGFLFFGYMAVAHGWYARDLFLGRAAARRGDFALAQRRLEAALERFEALVWIDRLRLFLLLSPTRSRFRESAFLALAHVRLLAGDPRALDAFERCAAEYPKSASASAALMLLRVGVRIGARGGRVEVPDAGGEALRA